MAIVVSRGRNIWDRTTCSKVVSFCVSGEPHYPEPDHIFDLIREDKNDSRDGMVTSEVTPNVSSRPPADAACDGLGESCAVEGASPVESVNGTVGSRTGTPHVGQTDDNDDSAETVAVEHSSIECLGPSDKEDADIHTGSRRMPSTPTRPRRARQIPLRIKRKSRAPPFNSYIPVPSGRESLFQFMCRAVDQYFQHQTDFMERRMEQRIEKRVEQRIVQRME
jgi:hypothetical protein